MTTSRIGQTVEMAHLRCDFFSDVLGLSTSMTVLLPQQTTSQIGLAGRAADEPPALYLLHGLSDDDTIWLRRTSIERYAAPLGLAVVMPQVHRSFYTDEAHGNRYWTFLSEELPVIVHSFFRLSRRREDTFVAGLSMGGYGAMRWALRDPGRFGAAASLSGALDLAGRRDGGHLDAGVADLVFGDRPVAGSDDDLLTLVRQADSASLPALYVGCGTEDFLYDDNVRFTRVCDEQGVATSVHFGPGEHDWAYWDTSIQDVLDWLPVRPA
jgi:putative tributyrin esterase